jgi:CO/xanthine dehydrogenase FAD-binding subunit
MAELNAGEVAETLASALPDTIGDYAGSAPYRRRVVRTLIARQLTKAAEGGSS